MWYKRYITAFPALILLAVSSCTRDEADIFYFPDSDKVQIELRTNAVAPSYPSTRADENTIGEPMVLVYQGADMNATMVEAAQAQNVGGTMKVTLTKRDEPCRFVVIANGPDEFLQGDQSFVFSVEELMTTLGGTMLSFIEVLLRTPELDVPNQTMRPFAAADECLLMTGISDVAENGINEQTQITSGGGMMTLTRAVAKAHVVVAHEVADFKLLGTGAINVAANGPFVRTEAELKTKNYNLISYLTAGDSEIITGTSSDGKSTADQPLYLYETENTKGSALILKAEYKGTVYYYKMGFVIGDEALEIERNKNYIFNITDPAPGYKTLQDALDSPPLNMLGVEITVSDATGHEIVSNGQFYLAVSNSSVVVYGEDTDLNEAFVITTDAWSDIVPLGGKIEYSGGISGPTAISIAASPGSDNSTPVDIVMPAEVTSATATITVGNLVQTVTFERRPAITYMGVEELPGEDHVTCEIINRGRDEDWLSISGDGENAATDGITFSQPGKLYLIAPPNADPMDEGEKRTGGCLIASRLVTDGVLQRCKIYVSQNTAKREQLRYGYVSAFWRAEQTGERLIRMHRNANGSLIDGAWTAQVISGEDWIVLDTEPTSDGGVVMTGAGTPADMRDPASDATHRVSGTATKVSGNAGTTEDIYFRIGLRGVIAEDDVRYGLIALFYNDNSKVHFIYVRHGHAPDYLMRPNDHVVTFEWDQASREHVNRESDTRDYAGKFSPYNLTSQEYIDGVKKGGSSKTDHSQLELRGGVFTRYPSQAGAFFQWASQNNPRYAWHPVNPVSVNRIDFGWDVSQYSLGLSVDTIQYWIAFDMKNMHETCPPGYHRAYDAPLDKIWPNGRKTYLAYYSEINLSLWLYPAMVNADMDVKNREEAHLNSHWGYIADGFFDRYRIESSAIGYPDHCAVRPTENDVAYWGKLFFNPYNNASLYFPATGNRYWKNQDIILEYIGEVYDWSTGNTTSSGIGLVIYEDNGVSVNGLKTRHQHGANPIRCMLGEQD